MERLSSNALDYDDLVTAVYKKTKDLILNNDLQPGKKLRQEELARSLGVSRTPIIKALHLLVTDNLIAYTPRRGFTVKELSTREMAEIFYVRSLLDGAVAREAAVKANPDALAELDSYFAGFAPPWTTEKTVQYMRNDQLFHARLYDIGDVPLLCRMNEMFNISRVSYQRGLLRDPSETLAEHLALTDAVKNRDAELAERLARAHAMRSRARLLSELDEAEE